MADDTKQQPIRQPPRREISRRPVVVGLMGLAVVEAVAGGITWKVLSQGLHKIALAFAPPIPTSTSLSAGATLYIYKGHSSAVNSVAWSLDSKRIVSGSDDQTAQVWDATNGHQVLIYRDQFGRVFAVAWSPDGKHIASGGGEAQIQIPTPTPVPSSVQLFTVNSNALNFTVIRGQHNPASQTLLLTNTSSTSINWFAKSSGNWLSINPERGSLPPTLSQTITVSVSNAGLSPGTYSGSIIITAPEGTGGVFYNSISFTTLTVLPGPL